MTQRISQLFCFSVIFILIFKKDWLNKNSRKTAPSWATDLALPNKIQYTRWVPEYVRYSKSEIALW